MATAVEPFRVTLTADELRATFETLATEWRRRSGYLSFTHKRVALPEYQRIIGLGRPVVPLLLGELEREPDAWFAALEAITGENPVTDSAAGDRLAMANAWLQWGRQRGVLGASGLE
jgi:hypothetical protein